MNGKVLLTLAIIAAAGLIGCEQEGPTARDANTPAGRTGTARQGTETTPPSTPSEVGKAPGTTAQAPAQQEYVAGTEKMLNDLERQVQTLQQQQAQLPEQDREKAQQLQQQFEKELANARANLNKLRTASPEASRDLKVAVDESISDLQSTYTQLQSLSQGQRAVTRQQP
ncbi:MAG: hypothetical protein A2Y77_07880 [Planctomycetes bacterium RBG_13_62_9]|nr:MAG: hypothetical protein A2Y77_07880 [Planctomycetes bacterium RBG_13_62_9]